MNQLASKILLALMLTLLLMPCADLQGQDSVEIWLSKMAQINRNVGPTFKIDEAAVNAAGIRKITGQHIDLYTDVRKDDVGELVMAFDQAVDQWCGIFNVKPEKAEDWKLRAFLIADRNDPGKFKKAGLIPDDLPEFLAGFQRQHNVWLYLQPGNYYTRHLLLHEGTHGFMQWFVNGYGAPWYSEGMSELIGVHQWKNKKLTLNYRLRDRTESEYWGRVKQIKDDWKSGNAMTLRQVLSIDPKSFLEVRSYAWSWAGCEFLSQHPKTKTSFAALQKQASRSSPKFNRALLDPLRKDWNDLERDWTLFVSEIDYGYEIERGRLSSSIPLNNPGKSKKFKVSASQSWQTTTIKVQTGDRIRITGSGEFKIGQSIVSQANPNDPTSPTIGTEVPWPCQSNGITIEYYRGRRLGMLDAGIFNAGAATPKDQIAGLLNPTPVGQSIEFSAKSNGVLCLRINESPARMDNNRGALEVMVEKLE